MLVTRDLLNIIKQINRNDLFFLFISKNSRIRLNNPLYLPKCLLEYLSVFLYVFISGDFF